MAEKEYTKSDLDKAVKAAESAKDKEIKKLKSDLDKAKESKKATAEMPGFDEAMADFDIDTKTIKKKKYTGIFLDGRSVLKGGYVDAKAFEKVVEAVESGRNDLIMSCPYIRKKGLVIRNVN